MPAGQAAQVHSLFQLLDVNPVRSTCNFRAADTAAGGRSVGFGRPCVLARVCRRPAELAAPGETAGKFRGHARVMAEGKT